MRVRAEIVYDSTKGTLELRAARDSALGPVALFTIVFNEVTEDRILSYVGLFSTVGVITHERKD